MTHSASVEASSSQIRKLWERHGIRAPFRFLGFCLSLLPIPVIQQAGQVLDRHLSDKQLEARLEAIWAEIARINQATQNAASLEEAILEVARTVEASPSLQKEVIDFLRLLGTHQKEFVAISEDASFQQIVHSFIAAESAQFIARTGGHNSIENTTVSAERTLLHSSEGSSNYVNKTSFKGLGGAVSMDGMSTQGNITVSGSSVGFGPGSALVFGGNPHVIHGDCPNCGKRLEVDRRTLAGHTHIQCFHCKTTMPFSLPNS